MVWDGGRSVADVGRRLGLPHHLVSPESLDSAARPSEGTWIREAPMIRRCSALALGILAWSTPSPAQEPAHHGHDLGRVGRVRFPTSCIARAQPLFERGVALLHSFWYERAADAFREAAAADSSCAMASWGLAMSYLHPLWPPSPVAALRPGGEAAARARALLAPTPRERAYVEAIAVFYQDLETAPHPQRLAAWARGMARVHEENPGDSEAAIFHALALIATAPKTDTTYADLRRAGAMLEPLFARQPDHPGLAHYLIHSYDAPPLVGDAVRAANRYAGIAPSVPHAQHMPSHSYTLLGLWEESIAANQRSADAARRIEVEQRMDGAWDQRLHALDYLVYAYLQLGRDWEARRVVDEAAAVTRMVPAQGVVGAYALAAIPARYALEHGDWGAAAALAERPGPPLARAVTSYARALGAARAGDTSQARADLAVLTGLEAEVSGTPDPFAPTMVRVNRLAATAWLQLAAGDETGALRAAAEAADLEDRALKNPLTPGPLLSARELLGDMLLQLNRPGEAAEAYRAALARTPKRARSLAGSAQAGARLSRR
jgi:tetratricopeptide (TPR) repeat protein